MQQTRAVLFDLDGTLVAPTIDFGQLNRAVCDVIGAHGAAAALTAPLPALEMIAVAARWLAANGAGNVAALHQDAQEAILAVELAAAEHARPFDGVADLLAGLKDRGLRLGIVTRNSRAAATRIMAQGGLVCEVLLAREDVARVKPDPAHLLDALQYLGLSASQAIMCGDHPMDMVAAQRAGVGAVGVLTGGATRQALLEAGADLVLDCITALAGYWDGREVAL